jgi:hypothetical protein
LRQFSRARTKPAFILDAATPFHQLNSVERFKCSKQDKTVRCAFDEHIQHPVRAVTKINVGRARLIPLDERARARARERVTGFVVFLKVGFGLDNFSSAWSPN